MKTANSIFSTSPLITPERLERDLAEALSVTPQWAEWFALADPDALPAESMAVVRLGDKHPNQYFLPACSVAVLFEMTRFGNSVTTNTNSEDDDPSARYYPKLTYAGATKDNTPVSRIIMAASPREAILASHDPRDLHPDALGRRGAGKPSKESREVALRHAERCARKHADDEATVMAYLANLDALFAYHDRLFGIAPIADAA